MCPLFHYIVSHILWLCFEFSLSSVQVQWPYEMSLLEEVGYVCGCGAHTVETRRVWLYLYERRTKTVVTLQQGWPVCWSSVEGLRNWVLKFQLPSFSQEIKLKQNKTTCQWTGVIKDVIWKVCVCVYVCCPLRLPSCMPPHLLPTYSGEDMLLSICSDSPFSGKHLRVHMSVCARVRFSFLCPSCAHAPWK